MALQICGSLALWIEPERLTRIRFCSTVTNPFSTITGVRRERPLLKDRGFSAHS